MSPRDPPAPRGVPGGSVDTAPERAWTRAELGATAALALLAFVLGFQAEYSGDFHWHLALGNWSIDHAAIYGGDTLSHTFDGVQMIPLGWLGDVTLAALFRAGGYPAVYAARGLMMATAAVGLVSIGRASGLHAAKAAGIAALFLADGAPRFFLRPEIFALALFVLLIAQLDRIERRGFCRRAGLVPLICFLWVNLHGSSPLALVVIALVTGENLARSLLARRPWEAARFGGLGLASLGAVMVSPIGIGTLTIARVYGDGCADVAEFLPLTASTLSPIELLLLLATVGTSAVALAIAPRRASAWRVLLALAVGYLASQHRRFAILAVLSMLPLLFWSLAVLGESVAKARSDLASVSAWTGTAAAILLAFATLHEDAVVADLSFDVAPNVYPEAACAFIRDEAQPGRMINDYGFGGYLTWCLAGKAKVAIDQRTCILYPGWFYTSYTERCSSPLGLAALSDELDASYAVFPPGVSSRALGADPERWTLLYVDDQAFIYVRRDRPDTVAVAEDSHVSLLDPARYYELLAPGGLPHAERALTVQALRCPGCRATRYARCAVAALEAAPPALEIELATLTGDDRAYLGPVAPLLQAIAAAQRGDRAASRGYVADYVARGGSIQGLERLGQSERPPR